MKTQTSWKLVAALALATVFLPATVHAGSHYWSGANSVYFSDGGNWSIGGAPSANEQNIALYFPSGVTRYTCSNNIVGLSVSQINISGNNYLFYGNPVTLTTGLSVTGGTNTFVGPLVLGSSNVTVDISSGVNFAMDSAISGAGGLTKVGLGTLQYNWDEHNTYTGTTYVNSGMLYLTKAISGAAIVGPLVVGTPTGSPGTAIVKVLFGSQIAGTSLVTVNFTGVLQLTTDTDWIGGLVMSGGTVDTGTGMLALLGNVSILSGASTLNGKLLLYQTNRVFDAAPAGALTVNGGIYDAVGSAGIIKTGPGSLTLSGSNSFTGPVIVKAGYLTLKNSLSLAHSSGLTVTNIGIVQLLDVGITNVGATISGNGNGNGAIRAFGTNVWQGGINLAANAGIQCLGTNDLLTTSGWFNGPGGLTKLGAGKLVMAGQGSNNHKGTTTVNGGVLQLSKSGFVAIPGPLVIGDATNAANTRAVSLTAPDQIDDLADVTVNASGRLDLNASFGLYDTIGSLAGAGSVNLGLGGSLAAGTNDASTTFSGSLTGWGGTFTKQGDGSMNLSGNNVNFICFTVVATGELSVNGDLSNSSVTVNSGATLDGSGIVGQITDGGMVSPGNSPGLLTSKDASFNSGSTFNVQINGTVPGASYDQLNVIGTVTLSNVTLNATLGFAGAVSNRFVIVQNDSTDPVVGVFRGLPEGTIFGIGGAPFQITYQGGQDNNDVVLTQIGPVSPPQIGDISSLPNGQIKLTGSGIPNSSYTVLANNDLNTTNWIALGIIVAGQNGSMGFTDTDAPKHSMRFYRFLAN